MTINFELPYTIENVSFAFDQIIITYLDNNKRRKTTYGDIVIAEQIAFPPDLVEGDQLQNLMLMLCDLIDDLGTQLRNPPDTIR